MARYRRDAAETITRETGETLAGRRDHHTRYPLTPSAVERAGTLNDIILTLQQTGIMDLEQATQVSYVHVASAAPAASPSHHIGSNTELEQAA